MISSTPSRPGESTQCENDELLERCVTVRIPVELIATYRKAAIAKSSGVPANSRRRRYHDHSS